MALSEQVDGSEIEWALGAAYKEAADFLTLKSNLRPVTTVYTHPK